MSDISVEFATNADLVAGQIDNAERSTNKAAQTAEVFNRGQRGIHETATIATRSLRGLGEAGRLFSIAGSGMAREAGGLIHILTSLGGPVGLAAGAAIAAVGIGMHIASKNAEELAKATEEAAKAFEELTKKKDEAGKSAASEGEGLLKKYGPGIRAAAFGDGSYLPKQSVTEQKLIERGMSPEDAAGIAASRQRYKDNGGLLGGPSTINNDFNWRSQSVDVQRSMIAVSRMNEMSGVNTAHDEKSKQQLLSGEFLEAMKDTAANTKDMVTEFRDLNGQTQEHTQKANEIHPVPMTTMEHIRYGY